jgi:hypothetical protein
MVGTRAQSDDFQVQPGGYAIAVSAPVPEVSTCQVDVLGAFSEVVTIESSDEGFTLDDGQGAFDCFLETGGAIACERLLEVPGLEFSSTAVGAFTNANQAVGALQVEVHCTGSEDECAQAEQLLGELPCTAYHSLELEAAPE